MLGIAINLIYWTAVGFSFFNICVLNSFTDLDAKLSVFVCE